MLNFKIEHYWYLSIIVSQLQHFSEKKSSLTSLVELQSPWCFSSSCVLTIRGVRGLIFSSLISVIYLKTSRRRVYLFLPFLPFRFFLLILLPLSGKSSVNWNSSLQQYLKPRMSFIDRSSCWQQHLLPYSQQPFLVKFVQGSLL